jgi:hypothetical protein
MEKGFLDKTTHEWNEAKGGLEGYLAERNHRMRLRSPPPPPKRSTHGLRHKHSEREVRGSGYQAPPYCGAGCKHTVVATVTARPIYKPSALAITPPPPPTHPLTHPNPIFPSQTATMAAAAAAAHRRAVRATQARVVRSVAGGAAPGAGSARECGNGSDADAHGGHGPFQVFAHPARPPARPARPPGPWLCRLLSSFSDRFISLMTGRPG